jgi:predicted NBD/HSP70 family sugar kinase
VKLLASNETERRRFDSGDELTPTRTVEGVLECAEGWTWDVISIGIPTPIRDGKVLKEPINLGVGWVGFDFESAFGKPTRVVNDAAMQAVGSYEGGRMLFLGLGTGLGSTLIADGVVVPLELGHLPFRKHTFEDYVGDRGREKYGKKRWRAAVFETIEEFRAAFGPDYIVLGGGDADRLGAVPDGCRLGANENAFVGGVRLWDPDWDA